MENCHDPAGSQRNEYGDQRKVRLGSLAMKPEQGLFERAERRPQFPASAPRWSSDLRPLALHVPSQTHRQPKDVTDQNGIKFSAL